LLGRGFNGHYFESLNEEKLEITLAIPLSEIFVLKIKEYENSLFFS